MDNKTRARINKIYYEKYLPAFHAFMMCYPLFVESLPTEIWSWISGYEGLYQISKFGRVKSFKGVFPIILKPFINKKGYLTVALLKNGNLKNRYIRILVAQAFIPNPENKPEVNYLDGIKFNCYFENLTWATHSENQKHAYNNGLRKSNTKLTAEEVREIRGIYFNANSEFCALTLAEKFNVSETTIRNVIKCKTYKNVK